MPDGTPRTTRTARTEHSPARAADVLPQEVGRTEPARYLAAGDYWFHETGSARAERPGRGFPAAVCGP